MLIDSKSGVQRAALDDSDAGEGLAIFFSQEGNSVCRYRILVKARIDQGYYDMGEFFISPPDIAVIGDTPPGRLSRMVGAAICPGAIGWSLDISAVPDSEGLIPEETAEVVLASSKCCASPVGVSRVGERYGYAAGNADASYPVPAGQTITGIAAIGAIGGGTIVIDGGYTIVVPEGISVNFEPMAPIRPNAVIVFTDLDSYAIEYLESA